MGCIKSLPLNLAPPGGDVSLEQAIYVGAPIDKIFGVSGQWIHRYNATTGVREASQRWAEDIVAFSSLTSIGSIVYVAGWWSVKQIDFTITYPNRDIFEIDPTFVAPPLSTGVFAAQGYNFNFTTGPYRIVSNGSILAGLCGQPNQGIFNVDPDLPLSFAYSSDVFLARGAGPAQADICYDVTHDRFWIAQAYNQDVRVYDYTPGMVADTTGAFTLFPTGICFAANANKAFIVDNTNLVTWFNGTDIAGGTLTKHGPINLGIGAANPWRIRFNSVDGLVYVPCWAGDAIVAINPMAVSDPQVGDPKVATYTGFSSPIDCVFTPTKKWAVQSSAIGLKEIV